MVHARRLCSCSLVLVLLLGCGGASAGDVTSTTSTGDDVTSTSDGGDSESSSASEGDGSSTRGGDSSSESGDETTDCELALGSPPSVMLDGFTLVPIDAIAVERPCASIRRWKPRRGAPC